MPSVCLLLWMSGFEITHVRWPFNTLNGFLDYLLLNKPGFSLVCGLRPRGTSWWNMDEQWHSVKVAPSVCVVYWYRNALRAGSIWPAVDVCILDIWTQLVYNNCLILKLRSWLNECADFSPFIMEGATVYLNTSTL